jgi:flagellar basal body L-ring protein FlgH
VNIEDVNDNDPVFDVLDKGVSIVEGNATVIGTVFGSVRATDVDVKNTITYSLRYLII